MPTNVPPCTETRSANVKVLVAEDHPTTRKVMSAWLSMGGYDVLSAADGNEAWRIAQRETPAIVVTDWNMPGMTGIDLCREIRRQNPRHQVYILIATARDERQDLTQAMEAGADDFLTKPVEEAELMARVQQAQLALQRFQVQVDLAETDPLTGVMNRRTLTEQCEREIERARRYDRPLACALLDVDLFKFVNDTFGHSAGDQALRMVANTIKDELRECDYVSRYGGDEFSLLLPESNEEQAAQVAGRIRAAIAKQTLRSGDRTVPVKVTIGVAEWKNNIESGHELFDLADQALLMAKQAGRNRVSRFSDLTDVDSLDQTRTGGYCHMISSSLAGEVMTSPIVCLWQDEPLSHAADLFLRARITSIPVVDEGSHLVGIVSERDLLNTTLSAIHWKSSIRNIMRTDVVSYQEHARVMDIWEFLRRSTTRRVVIVKGKVPVGVISRGSLLRWLGNWGMLRSARPLHNSDDDYCQLREHVSRTMRTISNQMDQLQSDLACCPDQPVPTIVNAATQLQAHAQELLVSCQIDYTFEPTTKPVA